MKAYLFAISVNTEPDTGQPLYEACANFINQENQNSENNICVKMSNQ